MVLKKEPKEEEDLWVWEAGEDIPSHLLTNGSARVKKSLRKPIYDTPALHAKKSQYNLKALGLKK